MQINYDWKGTGFPSTEFKNMRNWNYVKRHREWDQAGPCGPICLERVTFWKENFPVNKFLIFQFADVLAVKVFENVALSKLTGAQGLAWSHYLCFFT